MGARVRFDDKAITAAMLNGIDVGLVTCASLLGSTVKSMLSKPGSGRVYARRGAARKALGRGFLTRQQAATLLAERRAAGVKNKSLRKLGFHKASAPGQPPAADTGHLRRTWQLGFKGTTPKTEGRRRVVRVGSNAKYARRLEYGGGNIAARPYLRPSVELVRPKCAPIVNRAVAFSLARAGIGRKR